MSSAVTIDAVGGPTDLGGVSSEVDSSHAGWIQSRWFDLAFFSLSPLAGVFLVWVSYFGRVGIALNVAAVFLVAIPHYLSSFSFYLGDDNLAYYRSRWIAFFAVPFLVIGTVVVMRLTGWNDVLQAGIYSWNVFHVSRQSSGILALYRRLGGGNPGEKPVADVAFVSLNGAMALWHIDRFPPLFGLLAKVHVSLPSIIGPVFLVVAVLAWGKLLFLLRGRTHRMRLPEASFLISSALLFHPYLWVKDSNVATFAMLMGHFIQYLSIVWLLHARKYSMSRGSWHQRVLGAVSRNLPALGATLLIFGLIFYIAQTGAALLGVYVVYLMLWNALAVVHFYLDGLIWAFKRPFVRQSIGSYLTLESHRVRT